MILSSPFSRQNRSHRTWTGPAPSSSSPSSQTVPRRPPPQQPAPQPAGAPPQRAHTLNRLDLERHRRRHYHYQQHQQPQDLQRSLSLSRPTHPPHQPPSQPTRPMFSNGFHLSQPKSPAPSQIYAPASIASPREFQRTRVPAVVESHHYAATSFRGTPSGGAAASESGRSATMRPDSALGQILERFGSLRRRARWSRSLASKLSMQKQPPGGGGKSEQHQVAVPLDPEIYANGRREVQADEIYAEGLQAIDGNIRKRLAEDQLDEGSMKEGEIRVLIEEQSKLRADYQELVEALTNWINDELAHQRIIVKDLQEDLYDGQILGKLIEKLHHIDLDLVEVTQNEQSQRFKLGAVLDTINRILSLQARWASIKWTVEGIHGKNMVEIIHLLVTLALYYQAPIKLPPNVRVTLVVVQKCHGQLMSRSHEALLTDSQLLSATNTLNHPKLANQRDAFDALFEFAPEKLDVVKGSLANFCNRHLNKINISCSPAHSSIILDPERFSDGLLLVFLMASLENYFVPLGDLFTVAPGNHQHYQKHHTSKPLPADMNNNSGTTKLQTAIEPTSYINAQPIHKLHNVHIAFQLMEEAGLDIRDRVRPEDIVNGDLKSVLRVLYSLFSKYKHL